MSKKVLIAGGSGLVGKRLCHLLLKSYDVSVLTRGKTRIENKVNMIHWNIQEKKNDIAPGDSFDVVINLTGAGIADKRWTSKRKNELINSRVKSTEYLGEILANMSEKPEVYIGASAIGYYGERGESLLTETDEAGSEFLCECCILWEKAHESIRPLVGRFVVLRIGIVLSTLGGAMKEIVKPVKMGVAGYFGMGKAYYSWIHMDDLCGMFLHTMENTKIDGYLNAVSKTPVTIKELVNEIKKVYRPWALMVPVPSLMLKLGLGEMSKMLLNSTRVISSKWKENGFIYKHNHLATAIKDLKSRQI